MTLAALLLDSLPGLPIGGDDPSALERWTDGRDLEQILVDCLADFRPVDAVEIIDAIEADGCQGTIVARDDHPMLAELVAWAETTPTVVLVAARSGPPPPAVVVLEKAEP